MQKEVKETTENYENLDELNRAKLASLLIKIKFKEAQNHKAN